MVLLPETIPFLAELMEGMFSSMPSSCHHHPLDHHLTLTWFPNSNLTCRRQRGSRAQMPAGHHLTGKDTGRIAAEILLSDLGDWPFIAMQPVQSLAENFYHVVLQPGTTPLLAKLCQLNYLGLALWQLTLNWPLLITKVLFPVNTSMWILPIHVCDLHLVHYSGVYNTELNTRQKTTDNFTII